MLVGFWHGRQMDSSMQTLSSILSDGLPPFAIFQMFDGQVMFSITLVPHMHSQLHLDFAPIHYVQNLGLD